MPNSRNQSRETRKAKVIASEKSNQSFKSRSLTLLRYSLKSNCGEMESTVPTVTLAGKWMYDAGFRSGQKIEIIVRDRQLIIQVESEACEYVVKRLPVIEWERMRHGWTQTPEVVKDALRLRRGKRNSSRTRIVSAE